MTSTYTSRLGLVKQGTGDNTDTWGTQLNQYAIDLIDEAISGVESIAIASTTTTLTSTDGASNQARNAILKFTGTLSGDSAVVVPAREKLYLISNSTSGSFTLTIKVTGQTGVVIPQGMVMLVYCDGTDVRDARTFDMGSNRIQHVGTPTVSTDAATKAYADSLDRTLYVGTATSAGSTLTLDYSTGSIFEHTFTGATTVTLSNPAASSESIFVLRTTNAGLYVITHPADTVWPNGVPPTLSTAGVDEIYYRRNVAGDKVYGAYRIGFA